MSIWLILVLLFQLLKNMTLKFLSDRDWIWNVQPFQRVFLVKCGVKKECAASYLEHLLFWLV